MSEAEARMFPHLSLATARRFAPEGRRNFLIGWETVLGTGTDQGVTMFRTSWIACPIAALAIGISLATFPAAADPSPKDVLKTYADIGEAAYSDAADTARTLKLAVDAFLAHPTDDNLRAARAAWIAARIPYMQTEAFRFGNPVVDDWEGRGEFLAAR